MGDERGKRDRVEALAERILDALDPRDEFYFRKPQEDRGRDRDEVRMRYLELERTLDYESAARQARLEWLCRVLGAWDRAPGWVALADRPPDRDSAYAVFVPTSDPDRPLVTTAWFDPGSGWSMLHEVLLRNITHWMPLPGPPDRAGNPGVESPAVGAPPPVPAPPAEGGGE